MTALESTEALGQSAAQELEPFKTLQKEMARLATRLEPMKSLYQANGAHPCGVSSPCAAPGKIAALHLRMAEFARTFEPVNELAARFAELVEAFGILPAGEGTVARGNGRRMLPAPVTASWAKMGTFDHRQQGEKGPKMQVMTHLALSEQRERVVGTSPSPRSVYQRNPVRVGNGVTVVVIV